jgi:hypothetical protein
MTTRPTTLERAFLLAKTGDYEGVSAIRAQLLQEGYYASQLEGPSLNRQLRKLCTEARAANANTAVS